MKYRLFDARLKLGWPFTSIMSMVVLLSVGFALSAGADNADEMAALKEQSNAKETLVKAGCVPAEPGSNITKLVGLRTLDNVGQGNFLGKQIKFSFLFILHLKWLQFRN